MFYPQQLQVNGIDVVVKGHKARRAIVYGINGVLKPVKRNCDVVTKSSRLVSASMKCILSDTRDFLVEGT